MSENTILQIKNLSIQVKEATDILSLTDRVCLYVKRGELFGLVGESGCGKTITAQAILRLLPSPGGKIVEGEIYFDGNDLLKQDSAIIQNIRGKEIAMIFQEPSSAMNPLMTIGKQLQEVFDCHQIDLSKEKEKLTDSPEKRIQELLCKMGFSDPSDILFSYPHQLSGGMLQRVMIAMALLLRPKLLIADEPTTALDVTVQAQVMELLLDICKEEDTAVLFITHNLGLIAQYADRLSVMYAGRIVETGKVLDFFNDPLHPYSSGLLGAFPDIDGKRAPQAIHGYVPSPREYGHESGCRFRTRCLKSIDKCINYPTFKKMKKGQEVACFLYEK